MTPNEARDALIARRADLLGRIAGIDDRLDDPVDRDSEEAAIETEDDQMLQTLGAVERAEVARIRAEYGAFVRAWRAEHQAVAA